MNCPRCKTALAPSDIQAGGHHATVALCANCGGQWMKANDLQRLGEVTEPVLVEVRNLPPMSKQLKLMDCPECTDHPPLTKFRPERDPNVMLDFCRSCRGVWLDKNELEAIQKDGLANVLADLAKFVMR